MGMGVPTGMGFPQEWELDLNKDGNGNTTTWEYERLMHVESCRLVKSHRTTLCALCGFHTKAHTGSVIYVCLQ